MRRRVAICMPMLAPYAVPRFAELARDERLEVSLLVETQSLAHRPGWAEVDVPGCRVVYVPSIILRTRPEDAGLGYTVSGVRLIPYGLMRELHRLQPEIVLTCNATEMALVTTWRKALGYRVGLLVEDTPHTSSHKTALSRSLREWQYRRADFCMPFGQDSMSYLAAIGITAPVYPTSWSVDTRQFVDQRDPARAATVREGLRAENRVLFVTVAQLIPRKGIMDLLRAWGALPNDALERSALAIIGDGDQREEIESYLARAKLENVHLVGHLGYREVRDYYSAADVFVLPTLQDRFSLTVLEAMASGLPVITTIYNGARELVVEGVNGHVVDPRDVDSMAAAIVSMTSSDRIHRFSESSLKLIERFSHEAVMGRFADALVSACHPAQG